VKPAALLPDEDQVKAAREIPRWAGQYARNRTLASVVFLVVIGLAAAALALLAGAAEGAYEAGNWVWAACLAAFGAVVLGCLLWFRFVSGRTISRAIAHRLYGEEGTAATERMEQIDGEAHFLCRAQLLTLCCVVVWFALFLVGVIPNRQMMPTSVISIVPSLYYFFAVRYRGAVSPFMLLWPALYAVHALLLVMGAPIYFQGGPRGIYEAANMVIPTLGYGLLSALLGHLYSRLALRRLRALADRGAGKAGDLA
jgi:hypothetical protein